MTNKGSINLDIGEYIDYGLEVYDRENRKVGKVDDYDRVTGYLTVKTDHLSSSDLYIPFSEITNIDARDLFLAEVDEGLRRKYRDPPPRTVVVRERIDSDTGEDDSLTVIKERSGYDGRPVTVGGAEIGKLAHRIARGYEVYTSQLELIGTVTQYDRETKQMLVEQGRASNHHMMIPVALVEMVDRDKRTIFLAVSAADLRRMESGTPGVATMVAAAESDWAAD